MKYIFFLFAIVYILICCGQAKRDIDLIIEKVETRSNETVVKLSADVKEINGSWVMNVSEDYLQDIRDKYLFHIELFKLNENGQYEQYLLDLKFDLCRFLKTTSKIPLVKRLYDDVRKFGRLPMVCPIKKGKFFVENYRPNIDLLPPFVSVARFRLDAVGFVGRYDEDCLIRSMQLYFAFGKK